MFYCDECAEKREWPQSLARSYGVCEVCQKRKVCNDTPSSALPLPPAQKPETEVQAIRREVAAGSDAKAADFHAAVKKMRGMLQEYGGEMLLKAVAIALIEGGNASNGAQVGRVINNLADVEW